MKSKNWMPRVATVLRFGRLNESVEKQVELFIADKVNVLCESYMLSVITLKTLVPVYRELYRLMLMLAMQMLWIVFMMLGMTNVHWVTWRNSLIANLGRNFQFFFPKVIGSSLGSVMAIEGRLRSLLRSKDSLWYQASNARYLLRLRKKNAWTTINEINLI